MMAGYLTCQDEVDLAGKAKGYASEVGEKVAAFSDWSF